MLALIKEMVVSRLRRLIIHYRRFGLLRSIRYLVMEGLIKRPWNVINYISLRKRYPQNIILICGFPKSGSTWLMNLCASVKGFATFAPSKWGTRVAEHWDMQQWDLYNGMFGEFRHYLAVIRGHTQGTPANISLLNESGLKFLITIRDPRDKLISEYWHSRNYPLHWQRDVARKMDLSEFISYKLDSERFSSQSLEWLRSWNTNRTDAAMIIKYEELLADTGGTLARAFRFLGIECDAEQIQAIVKRQDFTRISGRKRGVEDNKRFVRKGVAGEWREIFTPAQKERFSLIGEDLIKDLGYQNTLD